MLFALIEDHLNVTLIKTILTARLTELASGTLQLNHTLETLTKWLIGLTIALGIFALPLAVDMIFKWLK